MYSGVLGTLAACSSARELDPRLPGCKGLLLCRIICILGTGEHAKCPSQELISGPTLNPSLCYLHNSLALLVSLCDQQQKQNPDFCLNSSKAENHKKEKKKTKTIICQDPGCPLWAAGDVVSGHLFLCQVHPCYWGSQHWATVTRQVGVPTQHSEKRVDRAESIWWTTEDSVVVERACAVQA